MRKAAPALPPQLRLFGEAACRLADGRVVTLERKDALLLAYVAFEGPTHGRCWRACCGRMSRWPADAPTCASVCTGFVTRWASMRSKA